MSIELLYTETAQVAAENKKNDVDTKAKIIIIILTKCYLGKLAYYYLC